MGWILLLVVIYFIFASSGDVASKMADVEPVVKKRIGLRGFAIVAYIFGIMALVGIATVSLGRILESLPK